jgi:hypothetical protein
MDGVTQEPTKVVHRVVRRVVVRPVTPNPSATSGAGLRVRAPRLHLGAAASRAGAAIGGGAAKVGVAVTTVGGATKDTIADSVGAALRWRIPRLSALPASIITGAVCGAVVTAIGAVLLAVFEWSRGTATGGGWWGSVSVAGLVVACFFLGSWLLREFGAAQPRATSLLAVILSLTGTLLLVEPANGPWAGALMPVIIVVGYVAAGFLTHLTSDPETRH